MENCARCKKCFNKEHYNQKYCSSVCYKAEKSKRHNIKYNYKKGKGTCVLCNSNFEKTGRKQKYCSYKCANKAKKKFLDIPSCLNDASRKLDKTLGYVRVYCPMHPEANSRGYVYEHRVIAEQALGRRLQENEVVHHRNGKRWDNRPENLKVMDHKEHGKLICTPYEETGDTSNELISMLPEVLAKEKEFIEKQKTKIKKIAKMSICKQCGAEFKIRRDRKDCCSLVCSRFYRRVSVRPSKEELSELLKSSIPITKIAEKYKVTDNTIRKWAKGMGLEYFKKKRMY